MESVFYAALAAFVLVLLAGPIAIPFLRRLRVGQTIREDGPARHKSKAGTPTMGGLLFVGAAVAASLWFAEADLLLWATVGVVAAFALLGFADDYTKVVRRRSLGLRARTKLLTQVLVGLGLYGVVVVQDLGTWVRVPLLQVAVDLGAWYPLFVVLVVIASANAVNLTDGLDGLAAGATVIALTFYLLVTLAFGMTSLAVFTAALGAATAAFLFFNAYPARVIMGDTGSLALGAALAALAVLTKTELLLPIVGGLFVIEALSVIVQVLYFRISGGRRLLRMSPLHHHFELLGWSEQKVVTSFWLVGAVFAGLGLLSFHGFGG